jgi:hypothetical protein
VDDKPQPDGAAAEHDERLLLLAIFCAVAGAVGRQPLLIAVFVACMASMSHWLEPSLPSAMATQGRRLVVRLFLAVKQMIFANELVLFSRDVWPFLFPRENWGVCGLGGLSWRISRTYTNTPFIGLCFQAILWGFLGPVSKIDQMGWLLSFAYNILGFFSLLLDETWCSRKKKPMQCLRTQEILHD